MYQGCRMKRLLWRFYGVRAYCVRLKWDVHLQCPPFDHGNYHVYKVDDNAICHDLSVKDLPIDTFHTAWYAPALHFCQNSASDCDKMSLLKLYHACCCCLLSACRHKEEIAECSRA